MLFRDLLHNRITRCGATGYGTGAFNQRIEPLPSESWRQRGVYATIACSHTRAHRTCLCLCDTARHAPISMASCMQATWAHDASTLHDATSSAIVRRSARSPLDHDALSSRPDPETRCQLGTDTAVSTFLSRAANAVDQHTPGRWGAMPWLRDRALLYRLRLKVHPCAGGAGMW